MLRRLGQVIYWIGCAFAGLMALCIAILLFNKPVTYELEIVMAAVPGVLAYLIGWVVRFVLSAIDA